MKKTYYFLPIDQYNQPIGTVEEILMTVQEYNYCKEYDLDFYYFEDYESALRRALD